MACARGCSEGFSKAAAEKLYLPVDPAGDAPTVESQEADPDSMLHFVRSIIALRHENADLQAYSAFAPYHVGKRAFAYKRGKLLLAVNPGLEAEEIALDGKYEMIFSHGAPVVQGETLTMAPGSFAVLKPVR